MSLVCPVSKANPQMATLTQSDLSDSDEEASLFRIAVVIQDRDQIPRKAINAASSPISQSHISFLVVVSDSPLSDAELKRRYHISPDSSTRLLRGPSAFEAVLQSDEVDALYVFVPNDCQRKYIMAALNARKHVLLDDPESTSLVEFREQLECARKVKRFIQFATMFVHQHRVLSFLDCVRYDKFGSIESIDVILSLNVRDVRTVGVTFPLKPGQGCIRRLGRYCALIASLMVTRGNSATRPCSAHVLNVSLTESGEPLSAYCAVRFTDDCVMKFSVSYTHAATRQVLEVRSRDRYATITDFVIPHRDALSTYRIYDKELNKKTGRLEVVKGEALDVPEGPSQDVMMWSRFREICLSIEEDGWVDTPKTHVARQVTTVALQTKRILTALEKSMAEGCVPVEISMEDCHLG